MNKVKSILVASSILLLLAMFIVTAFLLINSGSPDIDKETVLDRGNGTTVTIHKHGATVVSWRVNNQEQLFVSSKAIFDGEKPIRGGIPFVFPQFADWIHGPSHGFARISKWAVQKSPERLPSGDIEAIFSLVDNEYTRAMWDFPFRLTYKLVLGEKQLECYVTVYNPSVELTMNFNLLLHTYFIVPDVQRCSITRLKGLYYIDKTRDFEVFLEDRDLVLVAERTDRIYLNTPQEHEITNVAGGRTMRLQKRNFPNSVLWNPWSDGAKNITDLGDDDYRNMICLEAGHVSPSMVLLPRTAYEASQILQVV